MSRINLLNVKIEQLFKSPAVFSIFCCCEICKQISKQFSIHLHSTMSEQGAALQIYNHELVKCK